MRWNDFLQDGSQHRPYIIAEAGVNHEGDLNRARNLIEQAKNAGADAVKFQSYKAERLVCEYTDVHRQNRLPQFDYLKRYDSFWKTEYELLKRFCDDVGIEFLSTAFDEESALFLNDLQAVFKLASGDITHKPLIDCIASFGKAMILSTGGCDVSEIDEALVWIAEHGERPIALLHCIMDYPNPLSDANLGMISYMKSRYPKHIIGYSDHTLAGDMNVLESAFLLGARILEKHFTHNKKLPGNDHEHSMDPQDLEAFVKRLDVLYTLLGSSTKQALSKEKEIRVHARRSIVAARNLDTGHILTEHDLLYKRPALGVSPKHYKSFIGKTLVRGVSKDECIVERDLV